MVNRLAIGRFRHASLSFDEHFTTNINLLGLGYWSRFVVTFDFPNHVLYLKPSRQFDHSDVHDLSGLHFLRHEGNVIVKKVDPDSPAAKAAIAENDVLIRVDGTDASNARLFRLRTLLSTPYKRVSLDVRRGGKHFGVTLSLPGPYSAAPSREKTAPQTIR